MSTSPARRAAVDALISAAERFPDLAAPQLELAGLSGADTALAVVLYRTTVQRWLTLEYLLDRASKKPMRKMPATTRAVLLSGACQLLFLPGVAEYAAVDESVSMVRELRQPHAASMVNAVLRKIADLRGDREQTPWTPARDALPTDKGTLKLKSPLLPKTDNLLQHLAVATSHPLDVVTRWHKQFGRDATVDLCLHSLADPPTLLVDEAGELAEWSNTREKLSEYLAGDRRRRVQDATSLETVRSIEHLEPKRILDFCAGVGTKARQLAIAFPEAKVVATDVHERRRATLAESAELFENIKVVVPDELPGGTFDLILLDVPCSNSGVLARRAEAKYRLTRRSIHELADLQRSIVEQVLPWLAPGGVLLYATCSIEPQENEQQVAELCGALGLVCESQRSVLPSGKLAASGAYHDGGFSAILRMPI